jgi:hypothetical protein
MKSQTKLRRKNRYRLLLYDRFIGRFRLPAFLTSLALVATWFALSINLFTLPFNNISSLFLSGAILFFGFWLFANLGPLLAFTQAHDDHLRLQTPLYRIKIPYQQILNTRPVEVRKVFPPSSLSVGQHSLLKPLFGYTALAVDLQQLPPNNIHLRLFFHRLTFSPEAAGLVLIVDDWMGISNQLSDKVDSWRMAHSDHPTHGASDVVSILRDS